MPRYTATVAHELGKAEALARLRAATEQARTVSDLKGDWEAGTFDFSVTAQGLRVVARITVEEDRLIFDGKLPLLAMPFRNWIPRVLKKSLEQRLEPKTPSPSEGPEAEAPVVLFLHIPKAGGQTLGEVVYAHTRSETAPEDDVLKSGVAYLTYGFVKERPLEVPGYALPLLQRRDLRAVIGHFWFGLHEHVARPSVYVTALRNPVERVLSLYYYTRLHDSIPLEEFIANPPFREVDNDQTRRIAGVDPEIGFCTEAMLETAKENLRRFAVAGTIERLDDTLGLLTRRLGWQGPVVSYPRNVNPDRPASASLPRATIAAVRRRNELDFELWRFASELMDE
jgi:Putative polyhydroxyalkanoic acid system protein (PHA_gran_rgn)/Sulfotransferase family